MNKTMQNELRDRVVSFDRPGWMGGNQIYLVPRANGQDSKRVPELSRPRLASRAGNDLASGIAYLVLAGSLFASLLEFFASLPALP
jgi:hypothetical protein